MKRIGRVSAALAGILGLGISYAVAAEAVPVMAEGAEEAHKAGLPQFDPSSFSSQVFWLVITFTVLYVFFSRKTLPDIAGVVDGRRDHIQGNITNAEKMRTEAESVQKSYEDALARAHDEASKLYADADSKIKAETNKQQDAFREKSTQDVMSAGKRLDKAKAKALQEMSDMTAEIANKAASKIVGVEMDIKDARAVVANLNKTKKAA